ncbi:MAG: 50S ribosomal protein L29 [Kiritimatiellae bacterium]|jgi:large subunit ribosomal protein L29|nr:50S ribosomal protein L29 [Kiritimatiellia bacterium]
MTKIIDYREMTDEELASALKDAGESYFKLKMQQKLGQLENMARIREVRRDIARIQTVSTERKQAAGVTQETSNV